MQNMNQLVGSHDILWITLDTLRYDVAQTAFLQGKLPTLSRYLPPTGWEARHTPGSFTYAAHHAFFAGFLPTPPKPGRHTRLFATAFEGSESTGANTCVFEQPTVIEGLAARGYRTECIGGVGFFNPANALGRVLPSLFEHAHWSPAMGTAAKHSTETQVKLAREILENTAQRLLLFINVSAIHSPNAAYLPADHPQRDQKNSLAGHRAALEYVDAALAPLFEACRARGPFFVIISSDHGTAYGEDGFQGHRLAHEIVWTVPYAEFVLD